MSTSQKSSSSEPDRGGAWQHHSLLSFFTFMWGANFILAEVALREMAPISFSVARFLMGGLAMITLFYAYSYANYYNGTGDYVYRFRIFPSVRGRDWPLLLFISITGATLAPWLGIEGLSLTHGARASLWLAAGPIFSTGIGALFATEKLGRYGHIGVWLAVIGTLVLAAEGLGTGSGYWLGDLLLLLALIMVVSEMHMIKPLARKYGSVPVVAARTVLGGLFYTIIAFPSLAGEQWLELGYWTWIAILVGGAVGVGVGQWVKVRALNSIGPTRVVLYGNLVPIAAIVIAYLALGTAPSLYELIAGVLIVAGSFFTQVIDAQTMHHLPSDELFYGNDRNMS